MSFAIAVDELTLTDQKTFRAGAVEAGIARALKLGIAATRGELVTREAHPATDFGVPAGTGYGNEHYITGAALVNVWTSVFNTLAVPTLPVGRVAVFYKIGNNDAAPSCTAVRFRVGATGATTKASFFTQFMIDLKLTPECYLSEPVVYDPQDILFIEWYPRIAVAVGEELEFGCFITERVGGTIS